MKKELQLGFLSCSAENEIWIQNGIRKERELEYFDLF
jgi:hypothetical protein